MRLSPSLNHFILLTVLISLTLSVGCSDSNQSTSSSPGGASSKYLLSFLNLEKQNDLSPLDSGDFIDINGELILRGQYLGENLALEISRQDRPTPRASGAIFLHGEDARFLYEQMIASPREASLPSATGEVLVIREKRSQLLSCQQQTSLTSSDAPSTSGNYRCGVAINYKSGELVDLPFSPTRFASSSGVYQSPRLTWDPPSSSESSPRPGLINVTLTGLEARLLHDNMTAPEKRGPDISCTGLTQGGGPGGVAHYQCQLRRNVGQTSPEAISANPSTQE